MNLRGEFIQVFSNRHVLALALGVNVLLFIIPVGFISINQRGIEARKKDSTIAPPPTNEEAISCVRKATAKRQMDRQYSSPPNTDPIDDRVSYRMYARVLESEGRFRIADNGIAEAFWNELNRQ